MLENTMIPPEISPEPSGMAVVKKNVGEDVEKKGLLHIVGGNVSQYSDNI